MKPHRKPRSAVLAIGIVAMLAFAAPPARACTVFVLTDATHALFCNNEDWSDINSRIWFEPAGQGFFGAVYVGFENGWIQGGLNTEGLAFDWVAPFSEDWEPDPRSATIRGNPSRRMLETCAAVKDAIAFYRTHNERAFFYSKILVADKTGASAIIGFSDGQLKVEQDHRSRGFGVGRRTLNAALARQPDPTVAEGFKILRECRQTGQYATKYSNTYDLRSSEIFLYPLPNSDDLVKLNLSAELKKGAHYYEMPQIQEQLTQVPRPLPPQMKRLDAFKPIQDKEPELTAHVRAMIQDLSEGTPRAEDYGDEVWKKDILPKKNKSKTELYQFGKFISMTLVDRGGTHGQRRYLYWLDFTRAAIVQRYVFDAQNRLVSGGSEAIEFGL
jgi:hypothetical protein